jgi:hypothetical protein
MSRIQTMGSTANGSITEPIGRRAFSRRLLRAACLALVILGPGTVRGDLIFAIEGVQGPTGGVGSFEVSLTNPSGGTAADVAGFSFELSVGAGAHFTGVSTATIAHPYLFAGTGGASIDPGFTFSSDPFPGAIFTAADTEFTFLAIALAPGATRGLGLVTYALDPGASGIIPIRFQAGSSLSDPDAQPIDFTTAEGRITVSGVPEPSTLAMITVVLATVALDRFRPRRPAPRR